MKFDVRCGETADGTPIWKEGWIKALSYSDETVTLEVKATIAGGESNTSLGSDVDDKTVKLYSEDICMLGVHTKVSTSTTTTRSMTTRSSTQPAYLSDLQNKVATTHAVIYAFILSNLLYNYQY